MISHNEQQLITDLITIVPEIENDILYMQDSFKKRSTLLDLEDKQQLDSIQQKRKLHSVRTDQVGIDIIMEDILIPYIMNTITENKNTRQIKQVMDWIEGIAHSDLFEIRNAVATSICEPLITSFQSDLPYVYPYLGDKTRSLCKMQFSEYNITDATKKLFK